MPASRSMNGLRLVPEAPRRIGLTAKKHLTAIFGTWGDETGGAIMAAGGTLAAGGTSTTTWLEVFVSGWPPGGVPITEAWLANFPSLTRAGLHGYRVGPPGATAGWRGPAAASAGRRSEVPEAPGGGRSVPGPPAIGPSSQ